MPKKLLDLPGVYGDGKETVLLTSVRYPEIAFRVKVGTGWSNDGGAFGPHNAILREHLDEIETDIEDHFPLEDLVSEVYNDPRLSEECKEEEWSFFRDGCYWYEE